jgi:hypothetical protein
MSKLSLQIKEFFTLESETILNKIIEVIVKLCMVSLVIVFVVGWLTVVIATIKNPNIWDGVQFGLIDTMGY